MTKYSRAQAVLHWAVFLLIVQQFVFHEAIVEAFGAFMKGQEFAFSPLIAAHVFGGILVGIFAVARLWLRKSRGVPEELPAPAAQRLVAKIIHIGLYVLLIAMPVSGAVAWFGGVGAAAGAHEIMKAIMLTFVGLHIVGAIYHQVVLKDGIMARMSMRG
ncbi:MAG TPA: cytochrome B [Rhodobacteraceae bacterium]|jgi:cytochrome b561|nr:cytochrome B [Paracoccaceae bacterium]HBV55860.1 cytochrome B [Paracoccaceae bacterium]